MKEETLKVGEHFFNNDVEWVVSARFDWQDHIDYTVNRVSDGELSFIRQVIKRS